MYSKDELRKLKTEFWESFAAYCEVQPYLRRRRKMWVLYNTKVKGVELKFDATRNGAFVILEVNHKLGYVFRSGDWATSGTDLCGERRH